VNHAKRPALLCRPGFRTLVACYYDAPDLKDVEAGSRLRGRPERCGVHVHSMGEKI
jgi:hypothetical protein